MNMQTAPGTGKTPTPDIPTPEDPREREPMHDPPIDPEHDPAEGVPRF
jgi:hypothetical protein